VPNAQIQISANGGSPITQSIGAELQKGREALQAGKESTLGCGPIEYVLEDSDSVFDLDFTRDQVTFEPKIGATESLYDNAKIKVRYRDYPDLHYTIPIFEAVD